jgi:hypothetical protein
MAPAASWSPTDSGKGAREWRLLNTVENPNYVTADASRGRLDLAHQAGTLEEALDAADTIEARDSLERMAPGITHSHSGHVDAAIGPRILSLGCGTRNAGPYFKKRRGNREE